MSGLIPAHAGKTRMRSRGFTVTWAHPRSRGENAAPMSHLGGGGGSSPLTRGKPTCCPAAWLTRGLIPAHAGKTVATTYTVGTQRAHPRSRGENRGLGMRLETSEGSSPLTRGKLTMSLKLSIVHGLIPAHAGKTVERPR